jgi:RNA polymerase-associated protein
MYRIERDWCSLVDIILKGKDDSKVVEKARKDLSDSLLSIAPIFAEMPFFLSEEFTLVDCCLTPILWRLPSLGVELSQTKQAKPLLDYMDRMFEMPAFQASLSDQETEMR